MFYEMRNLFFILTFLPFTLAAQENVLESNDCVRSIPEPLMKKSEVTDWSFELDTLTRIGYERAVTANGDTLLLENKGCEYFWVEFEFKFAGNTNATDIEILRHYLNLADRVVDFNFGYQDAYNILKGLPKIEYEKEYYLNDNEIAEQFSLLKLDQTGINFSFGIGPL